MNENGKEIVRVLRVLEYTGPRDVIEQQLKNSLQDGEHHKQLWRKDRPDENGKYCIRVATVGRWPEVLTLPTDPDDVRPSRVTLSHPIPKVFYDETIHGHVSRPDAVKVERAIEGVFRNLMPEDGSDWVGPRVQIDRLTVSDRW